MKYIIDVTRSPEPEVDIFGHPYMIVGIIRIGIMKQLV